MHSQDLAIVIPYYKRDYFEETLRSLASQTDQRFSVYIGDDCSEHPANDLAEEHLESLDYHYQRFNENLGGNNLVAQWERCMALCKKEPWLMILGDDDTLSKDVVARFYEKKPVLEAKGVGLLKYGVQKIDGNSQPIGNPMPYENEQTATQLFVHKFYGKSHSSLSEYIFSRENYLAHGFRHYPLAWCSDDMAWLDFSGGKSIPAAGTFVNFRLSPQSISGSKNLEKWEAKRQFFHDLVTEKASWFDRSIQVKNLKRYEIFTVKAKKLKASHFGFFLKRFWQLGRLDECFKLVIRFTKNKVRQ